MINAPRPNIANYMSGYQGGFSGGGGRGGFGGGAGGFGGGQARQTQCYSCGGYGHMSRDCTQGAKCYNCKSSAPIEILDAFD
jgi:hypothetical protein